MENKEKEIEELNSALLSARNELNGLKEKLYDKEYEIRDLDAEIYELKGLNDRYLKIIENLTAEKSRQK